MKIGPPINLRTTTTRRAPSAAKPDIYADKFEAVSTLLQRGQTPSLKGASPEQTEILQDNLARVDRGVLLWAKEQGVQMQVLQSGEELEAAGVLRDFKGEFEERIDTQKIDAIHQHLEPLTDKIRSESDPDKLLALRRQKRHDLAELLTHNACGAAVFTPAFAPLLAPGLSKLLADPTETPTLKGMALHHGADSPEEQRTFYKWMEKLNGERLESAHQASVQERSDLLESKPEAQQGWLKQAQEKPETVPLDTTLHTLVVPDAHFFPSQSGEEPLLIDRSDLRSIEGWREGNFRGQWFFLEDKKNLLIRDSAVGLDTPIHELGHAIDLTLEKQAPDLYRSLRPRIEKAHYQARLHGHAITRYAMANRHEYIAEGFAAYYTQAEQLRETDPQLYQLVDEMVDFCCQDSGVERSLDRRLEKMQKMRS